MDPTTIFGACLFPVIFLVGVPGNCLVIWVFARKPRKTNTSILILSLAIIDLCACLIAPIHLVRALGGIFINTFICKFSIYGSRAFSFSALYLTTCIAIDRYMAICRPLESRSTTRKTLGVIMASIVLAVSGNFQYVLFVRVVQLGSVKKCIYRGGPEWLDFSNEIFTSISFVLTLVVCTSIYLKIFHEIRKQMKVRAALAGNGIQVMPNPQPSNDNNKATAPTAGADDLNSTAHGSTSRPSRSQDLVSEGGSGGIEAKAAVCNLHANISAQVGLAHHSDGKAPPSLLAPDLPSVELSTCQASTNDNEADVGKRAGGAGGRPSNQHRQRKERLMTRMLLGTNLILILSWLPSFILTNVPDEQVAAYRASHGIVVSFSYQLRTLNHIVSFFVYMLLNENFRRDCKAIFAKCSKAGRS